MFWKEGSTQGKHNRDDGIRNQNSLAILDLKQGHSQNTCFGVPGLADHFLSSVLIILRINKPLCPMHRMEKTSKLKEHIVMYLGS